jgi:transcriptional regulator with XRE-family HTH domain
MSVKEGANMFDVNKFGAYLSKLRKQQDMTQSELSEKLNVSRQAVSKYETGESFPDISILFLITEVFKISIDKLINAGEPTAAEAAALSNLALARDIPRKIFKEDIVMDVRSIPLRIKPEVLDRMADGLKKFGIDISNIIALVDYITDENVMNALEAATYETLDEAILEKIIPFLNDDSISRIFEKIIDGELDYTLLRVILPYSTYSVSLVEAAVVYGAIDEKALKIINNRS